MSTAHTPNPELNLTKEEKAARMKRALSQVMDNVDQARAVRLRNEYGRVRWLVSWYPQEDGFWLARLSCPSIEDTVEAIGQSRCLAIDSATRHLLDLIHQQSQSYHSSDTETEFD